MHPLPGLFFRWSERPWVPDAATFGSGKDFAEAGAGAMHCGAARASANRKQVGGRLQLPGGNRSRAENSHGYCCQKRVFDCLAHGSFSFFSNTPHTAWPVAISLKARPRPASSYKMRWSV